MTGEQSVRLIYIPCGREEEAASIAGTLVGERLIACANIYQSRSIYRWEGSAVDEVEHVLVCKTTAQYASAAEKRARELHSYEVPCIITLSPDAVNREYEEWVKAQVFGGRAASGAEQ